MKKILVSSIFTILSFGVNANPCPSQDTLGFDSFFSSFQKEINCSEEQTDCEECLKMPPPQYSLPSNVEKKMFLDILTNEYSALLFDYIDYSDEINAEESNQVKKAIINSCNYSSLKNKLCPSVKKEFLKGIKESSSFLTQLKIDKNSKKPKEFPKEVFKREVTPEKCKETLTQKNKKGQYQYSHLLYGYYKAKKRSFFESATDGVEVYHDIFFDNFPRTKYLEEKKLKRLTQVKSYEEFKGYLDDNLDMSTKVKESCQKIEAGMELLCTEKRFYDDQPFSKKYQNEDRVSSENISSINYTMCARKQKNSNRSNDQSVNINKKLLNISKQHQLDKNQYRSSSFINKLVFEQAEQFCRESRREKNKEEKSQFHDLIKSTYSNIYLSEEEKILTKVFFEPEKLTKTEKDKVVSGKRVSTPQKESIQAVTPIPSSFDTKQRNKKLFSQKQSILNKSNASASLKESNDSLSKAQTKKDIREKRKLANKFINDLRNTPKSKESSMNNLTERKKNKGKINKEAPAGNIESPLSSNQITSDIVKPEFNNQLKIEDLNTLKESPSSISPKRKNNSKPLIINNFKTNADGSIELSLNDRFFKIGDQKELIDLNSIPSNLNDQIFYLIRNAKSTRVILKNPYRPNEKVIVDLNESLDANTYDLKNDKSIDPTEKYNLIQMKTYIYKIGMKAIKVNGLLKKYRKKRPDVILTKERENEVAEKLYHTLINKMKQMQNP